MFCFEFFECLWLFWWSFRALFLFVSVFMPFVDVCGCGFALSLVALCRRLVLSFPLGRYYMLGGLVFAFLAPGYSVASVSCSICRLPVVTC